MIGETWRLVVDRMHARRRVEEILIVEVRQSFIGSSTLRATTHFNGLDYVVESYGARATVGTLASQLLQRDILVTQILPPGALTCDEKLLKLRSCVIDRADRLRVSLAGEENSKPGAIRECVNVVIAIAHDIDSLLAQAPS